MDKPKTINDLYEQIDGMMFFLEKKAFETMNSPFIIKTRDTKTVEFENVQFSFEVTPEEFIKQYGELKLIEPESREDAVERNMILTKLDSYCKHFQNDLYSRRCVLQPKYDDDENLASCMSFLQFLFRKDLDSPDKMILKCYCVMRSQNFENFKYDNASLFHYVKKVLTTTGVTVDKIIFDVKVISLHKYI